MGTDIMYSIESFIPVEPSSLVNSLDTDDAMVIGIYVDLNTTCPAKLDDFFDAVRKDIMNSPNFNPQWRGPQDGPFYSSFMRHTDGSPCSTIVIETPDEFPPSGSIPSPCGNPNHWLCRIHIRGQQIGPQGLTVFPHVLGEHPYRDAWKRFWSDVLETNSLDEKKLDYWGAVEFLMKEHDRQEAVQ